MPKIDINIRYTPQELRDQVLTKIPTRTNETLADVFDSLVKSMVEIAGFSEGEAQSLIAPEFLKILQKGDII